MKYLKYAHIVLFFGTSLACAGGRQMAMRDISKLECVTEVGPTLNPKAFTALSTIQASKCAEEVYNSLTELDYVINPDMLDVSPEAHSFMIWITAMPGKN